ncbi:unnamed protein product [Caenorhabditis sp. 36 PRJEB53466]|nr:unnamed protein product [Caenorhabditis sp. 36 PRJEB53466]
MDGRRSRSNSSNRSPRRKHRKRKHKSRRSRSPRSRTRSRSFERGHSGSGPARIHVNPAFGMQQSVPFGTPQMYPSTSQLLQQNNMLEAEVQRLKNALLAEQGAKNIEMHRAQMISQEIRNLTMQRDAATKRCNEVLDERRVMIDTKNEMANRMRILDIANRQLQDEVAQANRYCEDKNEEIRGLIYQQDVKQQQVVALNERNAALKTKCEAMVARNRQQQEENSAKQQFLDAAKFDVKRSENDLQCANIEIKRLIRELESAQRMESTSVDERGKIETILLRKEDEIRVANHKSAMALKTAQETIDNLENRLKSENPAIHNDMTVEAIYMAIETMKTTYEKQLARLETEIELLKSERMKQEDDVADHEDGEGEGHGVIEELPEYLQTPRKPDPAKMSTLLKTNQVRIDVDRPHLVRPPRSASGPPVDSPVTWHRRFQLMERKINSGEPVVVPLFGTTSLNTDDKAPECSAAIADASTFPSSSVQPMEAEMSGTENEEKHEKMHVNITEEELLSIEDPELTSPIQNLELIEEQQLLAEED